MNNTANHGFIGTILIVDDDIRGELEALPILLKESGFRVEIASNYFETEELVKKLQSEGVTPHIALVDMIFSDTTCSQINEDQITPRNTGKNIINMLNKKFPSTNLLLFTVLSKKDIPENILKLCKDIINKPNPLNNIVTIIKNFRAEIS